MMELIEELKHNHEINKEGGYDDTVAIQYIIERLKDIQKEILKNVEYFDYHNKNLTKAQDEALYEIKENLTSKGVFENE